LLDFGIKYFEVDSFRNFVIPRNNFYIFSHFHISKVHSFQVFWQQYASSFKSEPHSGQTDKPHSLLKYLCLGFEKFIFFFVCVIFSFFYSYWHLFFFNEKKIFTKFKDEFFQVCKNCFLEYGLNRTHVLKLPEGGNLEALHCQPSTKLDLTTEPPLLGRCC